MDKTMYIFTKLAQEKDRKFLTEGVKDFISGSAAATAATAGPYPLDTEATKRMIEAREKYKHVNFKDIFKHPRGASKTLRQLGQKFYGGLGHKLVKNIPAGAISFGVYGGTKRLLNELDKKANVVKQIRNYSDDVYKTVAKEVKDNYDVTNVDKFINKNLGRLKVRKGGKVMDIQDQRISSAIKGLSPGRKKLFMTLDADTGKAEITRRSKNVVTRVSKPGKKSPKNNKTLRNILLGGGSLATAGGAGYVAGSTKKNKSKDGDYIKKKIRSV